MSTNKKKKKLFAKEEILLQHIVSNYKIDLHFPKCKLAIEVDEKIQNGRKKEKEKEANKKK